MYHPFPPNKLKLFLLCKITMGTYLVQFTELGSQCGFVFLLRDFYQFINFELT